MLKKIIAIQVYCIKYIVKSLTVKYIDFIDDISNEINKVEEDLNRTPF
jgi:hypothetical protein